LLRVRKQNIKNYRINQNKTPVLVVQENITRIGNHRNVFKNKRRTQKMSYSSLWLIDKEHKGYEEKEYKNSWLFAPIIWEVLAEKYIHNELITEWGTKSIVMDSGKLFLVLNKKINSSEYLFDRICWELSNLQTFYAKDKVLVAEQIRLFAIKNTKYYNDALSKEHVIERFNEIADDIESIDENKFPFFVFKGTSVDDNVEYWFGHCDEETDEWVETSLKDMDNHITEFVLIKEDNTIEFISNLNFKY